jgi:hypothetical protein
MMREYKTDSTLQMERKPGKDGTNVWNQKGLGCAHDDFHTKDKNNFFYGLGKMETFDSIKL